MEGLKENKNQLPPEVYGALSTLMQFLEKVEDKYIEMPKEDKNENS
ncbi:MAG: hypothetical protein FWB74_00485 [Defluviitaleaceae bacterium]|nr:hypothetical protein [Defluviitaleaceae bacterium]